MAPAYNSFSFFLCLDSENKIPLETKSLEDEIVQIYNQDKGIGKENFLEPHGVEVDQQQTTDEHMTRSSLNSKNENIINSSIETKQSDFIVSCDVLYGFKEWLEGIVFNQFSTYWNEESSLSFRNFYISNCR